MGINSSFSDLSKSSNFDAFTANGDPLTGRHFVVSQQTRSCTVQGWMMMSTQEDCFFERGAQPQFHYSNTGRASQFGIGTEKADIMVLQGYGGKCSSQYIASHANVCPFENHNYHTNDEWQDTKGNRCKCIDDKEGYWICVPINSNITFTQTGVTCNTTSQKPSGGSCLYKGQLYHTGAKWDDGCDKKCECIDGNLDYYTCNPYCPVIDTKTLNPPCRLEKDPGQCCERVNCTQPPQPGCYYKGHYYGQDERWDDACDYKCQCTDALKGFYQCEQKCYNLQGTLPHQCHLDPPPANKCCSVVNCPPGVVFKYPPGYTPES